jgi:type IV pilus assembly protein PilA
MRTMKKIVRKRKGFTLIELLIVILVLAILMAVALPLYLAAVADSQVKTCRSNMQTIANAEAAYKTQDPTHNYTTTLTSLNANLGSTPVCPSGGTYSVAIAGAGGGTSNGKAVPAGGLIVSCSATGHGTFAPGIDAQ